MPLADPSAPRPVVPNWPDVGRCDRCLNDTDLDDLEAVDGLETGTECWCRVCRGVT